MKHIVACILLLFPLALFAQKTKRVEGEYVYYAPGYMSVEHAKEKALEQAQVKLIADEFGTNITQMNSTIVANRDGSSNIDFTSFSSSDVKGEWLETIGEPIFNVSHDSGMTIVHCTVKGVIREVLSAPIDIKAKVLRNGTTDKFEGYDFKSDDDMYLSFQSPVAGYLAVYLLDAEGNAFCLLPYRAQTDGIQKIDANKPYIFFSAADVPFAERSLVDEYTMTCSGEFESNQIHVLFSPNAFTKANDNDMGDFLPRELSNKDYQKWLAKVRKKDVNLTLKRALISIKK